MQTPARPWPQVSVPGRPSGPGAWTGHELFSLLLPSSDPKTKQPGGSKHKLTKAASLPGQNGNPTFAAVTAGYDKSPGGCCTRAGAGGSRLWPDGPLIDSDSVVTGGNGFAKVSSNKTDFPSGLGLSHTPVDSDGSDRYSGPSWCAGKSSQASCTAVRSWVPRHVSPEVQVGICQKWSNSSKLLTHFLRGKNISVKALLSELNQKNPAAVFQL